MTTSIEKFTVRFVNKGDKYGRDFQMFYGQNEPMIEFYDSRYPFTEFGQFIARYYIGQLRNHDGKLILDGGEPAWTVSAAGMQQVRQLIAATY